MYFHIARDKLVVRVVNGSILTARALIGSHTEEAANWSAKSGFAPEMGGWVRASFLGPSVLLHFRPAPLVKP